jgi:hypothetical protein
VNRRRTLEEKILLRILLKNAKVFIRNDFKDLGGYDQVGRALNHLALKKKIIKIGYGLYAKVKVSSFSDEVIPQAPLPNLAKEALMKLGVEALYSSLSRDYNTGRSTQIPTGRVIAVKSRVSRKIGYNGAFISYERIS